MTLTSAFETTITILLTALASSGFWAYLTSIGRRKDGMTKLLLGLAHDRIISLGMEYIERGWVTKDEYEDYMKYLYEPYSVFGGNGLAEKVVEGVKKLNIYRDAPFLIRGAEPHRKEEGEGLHDRPTEFIRRSDE